MLDELARRAAEEPAPDAPALEGQHIPADEIPPGFDFQVDPLEITADTLELLLEIVAPNWLADSTPEKIRLTRDKIEKLSKVYLGLLMKYLPGWIEKYPLEMMALVQTLLMIKPLVKERVPMRIPAPQPDKKPAEKEPDAAPAAP